MARGSEGWRSIAAPGSEAPGRRGSQRRRVRERGESVARVCPVRPVPMATVALLLLLLLQPAGSASQTAAVHLLADPRTVLRQSAAVEIVLGPVTKAAANPLLVEDRPWEAAWLNTYPTVAWDRTARKYKLWYNGLTSCPKGMYPGPGMCPRPNYPAAWLSAIDREQRTATFFAESDDGVRWIKPSLGVVAWNGSTANNIVVDAGNCDGNRGVFLDPHEKNASRRFKLFGERNASGEAVFCSWATRALAVAASKDGTHWTDWTNVSAMNVAADTACNALRDADLGTFLAFTRRHCDTEYATLPFCDGKLKEWGVRREVRSEAADFLSNTNWTYATEVAHGEAQGTYDMYSMVPFRSASWPPGLYFAVGSYYDQVSPGGQVYCELVVSSNHGANWTRLAPHKQFIPLGKAGAFDSNTCFASNGLLQELAQSEAADPAQVVHFYYAGGNGPHSGGKTSGRSNSIGLATSHANAMAGVTVRESDADELAVVFTRTLDVPSNAARLWVLVSSDDPQELKSGPAVGVSLVQAGAEVDGSGTEQSRLVPWELQAPGSDATGSAGETAAPKVWEVVWSGLSFAEAARGGGSGAVVQLKLSVRRRGDVLFAVGLV